MLFNTLYGIKSLGLRYFNVYGPRQVSNSSYSGVISKFVDCYRHGTPIPVHGDGEQTRDFIYVEDVARANFLALKSELEGAVNIATGSSESLNNLINYLEKSGRNKALRSQEPSRMGDIQHSYARTNKAENLLDFRYSTPLELGIQKYYKTLS
jgi:UDP-glucose 4-epimerase